MPALAQARHHRWHQGQRLFWIGLVWDMPNMSVCSHRSSAIEHGLSCRLGQGGEKKPVACANAIANPWAEVVEHGHAAIAHCTVLRPQRPHNLHSQQPASARLRLSYPVLPALDSTLC